MYPWKSILSLDTQTKRPKYLQITDNVIKEVSAGRLQPGQKLPGTRMMAELLELNRKTVILAFDELLAQGWLEVIPSSGTFISKHLPVTKHHKIENNGFEKASGVPDLQNDFGFIPSYLPKSPTAIIMDGGSPDPRLAPIDWLYKESRSLVKSSRMAQKLLAYDGVQGDAILTKTLAKYLSETRGLSVSEKNIMITNGSQMGIFLASNSLIKTNDVVVVGSTSYDAAEWTFQYCGSKIHRITVDEEGINTDHLADLCQVQKVKIVYITPHHHFPTTVTLSNKRRMHLLQLSIKFGFTILEDDYDFDFHYKSNSILPLASLNSSGQVIYIGSFSKVFAPNLRIGYLVAHEHTIEILCRLRRIIDRQGDHLMQHVLAEAIQSGELNRHLKKTLHIYRQRRDNLVRLLNKHLREFVEFEISEGGMAIWVRFKGISLVSLKPVINKMGLYMDIDKDLAKDHNSLRMGFASLDEEEQERAILILVKAIGQLSS
ncbi:MAG TPA: PLP-dependent aminotransferase family protein [Fulvivirga sp.]|nr:PLP-dependent aminotransferase family protein [Fulvivirga sp.]